MGSDRQAKMKLACGEPLQTDQPILQEEAEGAEIGSLLAGDGLMQGCILCAPLGSKCV